MRITIEITDEEIEWLKKRKLIQFRPTVIKEGSTGFEGKAILDRVQESVLA